MTFDYVPAPRTIFEGVHKLEPGSRFTWSPASLGASRSIVIGAPARRFVIAAPDEYELEALLEGAVRRQMVSDVPIGAFLSGGIDSSLLVAFMARHSSTPVRTFSVSFEDKQKDESPIAQIVAREFGTEHTVLRAEDVGPEALIDLLGRLDEPFCDSDLCADVHVVSSDPAACQGRSVRRRRRRGLRRLPEVPAGNAPRPSMPFASLLHRGLRALPWRPRGAHTVYAPTLVGT